MALAPLHDQLTPADIELSKIFLDPNNPRFVGLASEYVPDGAVTDEKVQERAKAILKKFFATDRVKMSMEVNGYLPIDRIIVRALEGGNFVVLEGNRRIAAAKSIGPLTIDGADTDEKVIDSLRTIPCLVYTGADTSAAWLFQGIRHISGVNDWSSYNKARLLVEQMEREGLNLTAAGRRFGLTAFGAGQWVRGYYAFKQARSETDYVTEVDERIYPYLQELFGRSSIAIKDWLNWDDSAKKFANQDCFNEFIGWFYPKSETSEGESSLGIWENRKIGKQDDIRQLSYLILHSPKHFRQFREEQDLEAAYGRAMVESYEAKPSQKDVSQQFMDAIDTAIKALNDIPLAMIRDPQKKMALDERIRKIEEAISFIRT
jgi:hypothetical protein